MGCKSYALSKSMQRKFLCDLFGCDDGPLSHNLLISFFLSASEKESKYLMLIRWFRSVHFRAGMDYTSKDRLTQTIIIMAVYIYRDDDHSRRHINGWCRKQQHTIASNLVWLNKVFIIFNISSRNYVSTSRPHHVAFTTFFVMFFVCSFDARNDSALYFISNNFVCSHTYSQIRVPIVQWPAKQSAVTQRARDGIRSIYNSLSVIHRNRAIGLVLAKGIMRYVEMKRLRHFTLAHKIITINNNIIVKLIFISHASRLLEIFA